MSQEKLLSVIIPVYNTAPYLERCISSIRKQSYQTMEIICVDNNSTDNSLELLNQMAAEDPRIMVLEQKKQGVSAARNLGIQNAHGEYITFVDSDDAIDPEMYSILVNALEKENAEIAHCGYRRFEIDGSYRDVSGTGEYLKETKWIAVEHLLRGEKYIGSLCNKIYRKELFVGLALDESIAYNEDFLLNFKLFNAGETMVFIDEPMYLYYSREESTTAPSGKKKRQVDSLAVSEKIWELFRTTEMTQLAANKYYYDLVCSFRASVFRKGKNGNEERAKIQKKIKALENSGQALSRRNMLDYRFMKICPKLYRGLYSIYDKIRKPNWDVK